VKKAYAKKKRETGALTWENRRKVVLIREREGPQGVDKSTLFQIDCRKKKKRGRDLRAESVAGRENASRGLWHEREKLNPGVRK